jgi:hypothetical protein
MLEREIREIVTQSKIEKVNYIGQKEADRPAAHLHPLYTTLPAILPSLCVKHVQMKASGFTEVKRDGSTGPGDVGK